MSNTFSISKTLRLFVIRNEHHLEKKVIQARRNPTRRKLKFKGDGILPEIPQKSSHTNSFSNSLMHYV